MLKSRLKQPVGASRMNRQGRALQKPVPSLRHGLDCMQKRGNRVRTGQVDNRRGAADSLCKFLHLRRRQLNRHAHVGGKLFNIGAKLYESLTEPLAARLTTSNQHAARHLRMAQYFKKRFASGMLGFPFGKDDANLISPSSTDNARCSLPHRGQRNVRRPLLDPMCNGRHRSRRGHDHHVDVIEMRKALGHQGFVLRKHDEIRRPAPRVNAVFFQKISKSVVGCPWAHQDDRLMRGSHIKEM